MYKNEHQLRLIGSSIADAGIAISDKQILSKTHDFIWHIQIIFFKKVSNLAIKF